MSKAEDRVLIGMMLFAPMAFASVHVWAYSLLALASLFLFLSRFLLTSPVSTGLDAGSVFDIFTRPPSIAILSFTALCAFYIIPLPPGVVEFISPRLFQLREANALYPPGWQALSAYPRATLSYLIKLISFVMVYFVVFSRITEKGSSSSRTAPRSVYPAFVVFGALAGVLSILFHGFVDFNLQIPANALYFTILLAIIASVDTRKNFVNYDFLNKLLNSIVIIGFFVGLFGIIQRFSWNGKMFWLVPKSGQNFGPFVCYNNFAGFMEMTSFVAIALFYSGVFTSPMRHMRKVKDKLIWFSSPEANKTVLYLFSSIVMVAALFLSSSRGGIISFALAFLIFAVICVLIGPRSRKAKLAILGFIVLGLFVSMIIWVGPDNTLRRFRQLSVMFHHIIEGRETRYLLRPLMWIDTVRLIGHFPIAGVGFGAYSNIFFIERTFSARWGFLLYAHQDYLNLVAETGIIGAAYLILFLVWYMRRFKRCIRRLRKGAENLERYI